MPEPLLKELTETVNKLAQAAREKHAEVSAKDVGACRVSRITILCRIFVRAIPQLIVFLLPVRYGSSQAIFRDILRKIRADN